MIRRIPGLRCGFYEVQAFVFIRMSNCSEVLKYLLADRLTFYPNLKSPPFRKPCGPSRCRCGQRCSRVHGSSSAHCWIAASTLLHTVCDLSGLFPTPRGGFLGLPTSSVLHPAMVMTKNFTATF